MINFWWCLHVDCRTTSRTTRSISILILIFRYWYWCFVYWYVDIATVVWRPVLILMVPARWWQHKEPNEQGKIVVEVDKVFKACVEQVEAADETRSTEATTDFLKNIIGSDSKVSIRGQHRITPCHIVSYRITYTIWCDVMCHIISTSPITCSGPTARWSSVSYDMILYGIISCIFRMISYAMIPYRIMPGIIYHTWYRAQARQQGKGEWWRTQRVALCGGGGVANMDRSAVVAVPAVQDTY